MIDVAKYTSRHHLGLVASSDTPQILAIWNIWIVNLMRHPMISPSLGALVRAPGLVSSGASSSDGRRYDPGASVSRFSSPGIDHNIFFKVSTKCALWNFTAYDGTLPNEFADLPIGHHLFSPKISYHIPLYPLSIPIDSHQCRDTQKKCGDPNVNVCKGLGVQFRNAWCRGRKLGGLGMLSDALQPCCLA